MRSHMARSVGNLDAVRLAAAATAIVASAGLLLQFVLFAQAVGVGLATWRFFGFFTILSNIGIAAIAFAVAVRDDGWLTSPRSRLIGLVAIVTVGFVYSILLRSTWNPQGLQKLADAALHDATPLLFLFLWVLMPHGRLGRRDFGWPLVPPAAYLAYALARGRIDGWYPYYFLNPSLQTPVELGLSILAVLAMFAIVAGCALVADRRLATRPAPHSA